MSEPTPDPNPPTNPHQWTLELCQTSRDSLAPTPRKQFGSPPDITLSSVTYPNSTITDITIANWFILERIKSDIWYLRIGALEANIITQGDGCVTILASQKEIIRNADDYQI